MAEGNPANAAALLALGVGLLKEFSGESHLQRAQEAHACCAHSAENPSMTRPHRAKSKLRFTSQPLRPASMASGAAARAFFSNLRWHEPC